ncbi:hypothetical protein [Oceanibium sediminis]|uniref:hypothetical protein n=1 Tax=Oceanibium sediminis TaxID=2026339 RepID=UPI000DD2B81D|nr:hypothetical protein [Oceanibium sediminis]
MDRTELTLFASLALIVAVLIGWGLRWVYGVLNPPTPPEPLADSEWAEYAKACEAARNETAARLEEVERDLNNRLSQAQAELSASMEALGDARRRADELDAELSALKDAKAPSA